MPSCKKGLYIFAIMATVFAKAVGQNPSSLKLRWSKAEVAHLVEHDLAKVGVAGSSPVFRSETKQIASVICFFCLKDSVTRVVELVDTQDLKSCGQQCSCGFNSHPGYKGRFNSGFFNALM